MVTGKILKKNASALLTEQLKHNLDPSIVPIANQLPVQPGAGIVLPPGKQLETTIKDHPELEWDNPFHPDAHSINTQDQK
jgi:hypothetical protein